MKSETGSILALIGGILEFVSASIMILISIPILIVTLFGAFFLTLGIIWLVLGIFLMFSYKWMKNPETTRKGGITALVCGIIGFNILAIIAGIIGITDSDKLNNPVRGRKK